MVKRLLALSPEEIVGKTVIQAELGEELKHGLSQLPPSNLGAAVEQQLNRYFKAHNPNLPPPGLYGRVMREVEQPLIERCLSATQGNQLRAAALLGLNRNTLRKKIRELKILVAQDTK